MHIYSSKWLHSYDTRTGTVLYYSEKVNRECCAVPEYIDGFKIDLTGWIPPQFEELFSYGHMTPSLEHRRNYKSNALSRLVRKHLGTTATDMRHRYAIAAIMNGRDIADIADAMGTSQMLIGQTYSAEFSQYRRIKMIEAQQDDLENGQAS